MTDFYHNEEELYFLLPPYATGNRIFVLFIHVMEFQSYQQKYGISGMELER